VASDRCGRELVMQTVLSRIASVAVVAAGILVAASAVRGREFAPGEVIVKFKENVGPGERANVRSQVGLKKEKDLGLIKAELAKVEERSVEDATRAL
jgi:uncharacterized protein (DUF697 family)